MLPLPDPPLSWPGGHLRPWQPEDAARLVDAWTDPEIARWNPVPPDPSIERASGWIDGCQVRLEQRRSVDLCIASAKAPDTVVGEVGLSGFDWDRRAALIGYWLLPDGRGQGLAAQATAIFTEWAFASLQLHVVVARCATDNTASQSVAQRAGYVHVQSDGAGNELWIRQAFG